MAIKDDIIRRIDAVCKRRDWKYNKFGKTVLNNPNFVYDFKANKCSPTLTTLDRVTDWLDENEMEDETPAAKKAAPKSKKAKPRMAGKRKVRDLLK